MTPMNSESFVASGERSIDVLALGEPLIEFNQVQIEPPMYLQGFGGDTLNAMIAAARAGAKTAYLTRLGQDRWADALQHLLESEGVDTCGLRRLEGQRTGLYFVHHDRNGHHFSYARAGSAASGIVPDDVRGAWRPLIADSHWLHLSGISMAISESARQAAFLAMQVARESGTRVSLDTNLRLSLWPIDLARQTLTEAFASCDLLLPSLDDVIHLSGLSSAEANLDWCHSHGAQSVVLKMGAQGAWVSHQGQRLLVEGRIVDAVDATGAGDCFGGNLLARLVRGDSLTEATRWANVAASLAVQGHGAIAPLPSAAQVMAALS